MATILAIHAHPDDIEHLGAGTLAILGAAGHAIRIVTATAGECGSTGSDLAATGAIRKGEAAVAAAEIGATYRCADLPDLGVFNDDAARRRMTEMVRWSGADIVITASPVDYHPDHEAVSQLVRDACFASTVPNYATGPAAALDAIPHLYFMDPSGGLERDGTPVIPDFGVDITAVFEIKAAMLSAHESQHEWVAKQHAITDHLGAMRAYSAKRGRDFGCGYAEAFRQYTHTPYPRTPWLQELLAGALRASS